MQTTAAKRRDAATRRSASAAGECETLYVDELRVARALKSMPPAGTIEEVAEAFHVLSDPTRIRLLHALSGQELCVCDLAKVLGRSISGTSHQLQALRRMRLVQFRMEGKLAYYSLCSPWIRQLLADAFSRASGREDTEKSTEGAR